MAITFKSAPTVSAGEKVTSSQIAAQADAFNSRIRSGFDWAWRVAMYWYNLFRQVRNPDETGFVFPAQAEWFELYQLIEPTANNQWPLTGPGENEGANLANPAMQFVYGVAPDLSNEADRISEPEGIPLALSSGPPQTVEDMWELGKMQRGVIDPSSGLSNTPAFTAAQSIFRFSTPSFSPHGKAYGGFFPAPVELLEDCGTFEDSGLGIPSFEIKFTNSETDEVVTYAGTCPYWTDLAAAGHVQGIIQSPFAYYVFVYDGAGGTTMDTYPIPEWIQGPYEGAGNLSRYDGGQINRMVWKFLSEFRGSDDQRQDEKAFRIKDIAFDFQSFLTKQYQLAPAIGKLEGDSLLALYPTATFTGDKIESRQTLQFTDGHSEHVYASGFVLTGIFAKASGLFGYATLNIYNGETLIGSMILDADNNGNASGIHFFSTAITGATLRIQADDEINFTSNSGSLRVEATELMEYKPGYWDAYLVTRMCSTDGGGLDASGSEKNGTTYDFSKDAWENLRDYGCIVNSSGASGARMQADWVTDNPVYESARRMTRDQMRILARRQFYSYEVAGGKSILRFKRYAYGLSNQKADCFHGIAPSYNPVNSGDLEAGETYIVRSTDGSVTYRGGQYSSGQTFTAAEIDLEYQAHGDALVYVYDGIRSAARKHAWSNEWVMFIHTKCYHPSESSIWKPAAYADYFAWNQRCHFYSGSASSAVFRRHTTYNYSISIGDPNGDGSVYTNTRLPERTQAEYIAPEAPSGYNYALGANLTYNSEDFFKSCQIYQAPYEIESATVEFIGGEEIVKLTFKTRFSHTDTAPATVSDDVVSWDSTEIDALRAESYRTDDNAIREYARSQADPSYQCVFRTGDSGTNSSITVLPDNPFGSCYPHFFFVKLIPKPYDDGNDSREPHDTRTLIDTLFVEECHLKAACEGFVDGQTSLEITCKTGTGTLYDYTFENLCFDAFGGQWISPIPKSVRSDDAAGFGPLPNTKLYADTFNKISQCVNLLTRVRVMLPFEVQCKTDNYSGSKPITPDWPTGVVTCSEGQYTIVWNGSAPSASTLDSSSDWVDCGLGASASSTAGIDLNNCTGSNGFLAYSSRQVTSYRVSLSAGYEMAIPEAWRDQVESVGGFVGIYQSTTTQARCNEVTNSDDADGCCPDYQSDATLCGPDWFDSGGGFGWGGCGGVTTEEISECRLISSGTLDPGTPPPGIPFVGAHNNQSPPVRCGNSSSKSISISILNEPGFYVEIPVE